MVHELRNFDGFWGDEQSRTLVIVRGLKHFEDPHRVQIYTRSTRRWVFKTTDSRILLLLGEISDEVLDALGSTFGEFCSRFVTNQFSFYEKKEKGVGVKWLVTCTEVTFTLS